MLRLGVDQWVAKHTRPLELCYVCYVNEKIVKPRSSERIIHRACQAEVYVLKSPVVGWKELCQITALNCIPETTETVDPK